MAFRFALTAETLPAQMACRETTAKNSRLVTTCRTPINTGCRNMVSTHWVQKFWSVRLQRYPWCAIPTNSFLQFVQKAGVVKVVRSASTGCGGATALVAAVPAVRPSTSEAIWSSLQEGTLVPLRRC